MPTFFSLQTNIWKKIINTLARNGYDIDFLVSADPNPFSVVLSQFQQNLRVYTGLCGGQNLVH